MLKQTYEDYKDIILLSIVAAMIGIAVGTIEVFFGKVLTIIGTVRDEHLPMVLPFLSVAGLLIVYLYVKFGGESSKGMGLIFSAEFGERDKIPKRLIPLAILSTWITHLFGGSAGREGVAVQIGGTFGHTVGRRLHIKDCSKILLVAGMAAGFSGLFLTPLAAIFFALEVFVVGSLEYMALLPTIVAAFAAYYTSSAWGLAPYSVNLPEPGKFELPVVGKLLVIAIVFGMVGGLFADIFHRVKNYFQDKIKNPYKRVFMVGVVLSISLWICHEGRYSGLGANIINACFTGGEVYYYDWILKFLFTIVTLSAGFQGGEVTTLFTIGASLGVMIAPVVGLPVVLVAALGYAAVFGSATNTMIAPIFIGAEIFGYEYLPYFFLVCLVAYVFNGNKSIYTMQRKRSS